MTPRLLLLSYFGLTLLCPVTSTSAAESTRPNVLIILADDLTYRDVSCCGGTSVRTPHIDQIFREGITLTRFRTNSSVCSPTRAALLTGRYPDLVGVPGVIRTHPEDNWGELAPDAVLLPASLKPAHVTTALVGKWHLGLSCVRTCRLDRGFDLFHGFLGDMMDDYDTHLRHGHNYMRRNLEIVEPAGHATDVFTDWAIDFLLAFFGRSSSDRRARQAVLPRLLTYNAPHGPTQPPPDWLRHGPGSREPPALDLQMRAAACVRPSWNTWTPGSAACSKHLPRPGWSATRSWFSPQTTAARLMMEPSTSRFATARGACTKADCAFRSPHAGRDTSRARACDGRTWPPSRWICFPTVLGNIRRHDSQDNRRRQLLADALGPAADGAERPVSLIMACATRRGPGTFLPGRSRSTP